jgi:membrane protease YdiL (CAAX protease family)
MGVGSERLSGAEKRALVLWMVAGVIGVIFAQRFFFRAFPEASVDFRVSRSEALKRAQDFLGSIGEHVGGYRSAVAFDVDDDAKTYLERELGLQQANQMMSSQLDIWYWDVRFYRVQQEEEFHVRVNPAGKVVAYDHKIPEARAAPAVDRAKAQEIARDFARGKLGVDLAGWNFLAEEANSNQRPNRVDWSFTWEKHGFRAKDAPYRLKVGLQGDRVGGADPFLRVPEAWTRSFARLRSGNDTLALVFIIPYVLLLGMAVWLGIKLTQQGQTSWRGAIVLGGIVAAMLFLQNLNNWPLWSAAYDTNSTWGSFIGQKLEMALLLSLATAVTITLVLPAAEPLYRVSQPERLRLAKTITLRGLRSKEFFSAAVVGLSLAAVHIGYVVGFYVIASKLGAWAPQELNYEDSVNTLFPWISGAAIGLLASTNEEFTFRLFAIPFFEKVTRSRWVAVILPAFLWSFLHSNYPQEPAYIRGIEIGIFGVVAGLVMLRWGILATLIWHYTVDASLVGLFLVRSNSLYFKVSGIVVGLAAAAPLLFAGISYLLRGGFEADEDLLNRAAPVAQPSTAGEQAADVVAGSAPTSRESAVGRYAALSTAMVGVLAVCVVAGGLIVWKMKPEAIGNHLQLSVNVKSAGARADEVMRGRGLDPTSWRQVVIFGNLTDPITNEFLRERLGVARVNEIYLTQVPGAAWLVRYFRDSQAEEYSVRLRPDGSVFAVHHKIAEDAPGASLSKDEAVALAEKFLREEKKLDLSQWSLVEANSEKRPHRIDHVLTWQQKTALDANGAATDASGAGAGKFAFLRQKVVVMGDEVEDYRQSYDPDARDSDAGTFSRYIKIPDEWRRKQEELTPGRLIFSSVIPILVLGGGGLIVLIIFLKNLRSETARAIPWRRLSMWAMWGLAAFYVSFAAGDRLASALNQYNTAIPLKTMYGVVGISALLGGPFSFGMIAAMFGIAWFYAKRAFGEERIPGWRGMPAEYYRDALFIGSGGAAWILGVRTLVEVASQRWPAAHRATEAAIGTNFDSVWPGIAAVSGMVNHSLLYLGLVALLGAFVADVLRATWLRVAAFLAVSLAMVGGDWGGPADLVKQWAAVAVLLGAIVWGVRWVMRFNIFGGFLALAILSLAGPAGELLRQPDRLYRTNGYVVTAVLVGLILWPLAAWRVAGSAAGQLRHG